MMHRKFNSIYIPIALSMLVLLMGLCLSGIIIFSIIVNGFTAKYMIDGSDLAAFMRLIFVLFCAAVLIILGIIIAAVLIVIWGIYGSIRFLFRMVKNHRKKDVKNQNLLE